MGLFRKLRGGSSTHTDVESSTSASGPSHHPSQLSSGSTTPAFSKVARGALTPSGPSSPASTLYPSPRLSSDVLGRPGLTQSQSANLVSKVSRNPWKRKDKEKDLIAGPSYESTPPRRPGHEGCGGAWDGRSVSASGGVRGSVINDMDASRKAHAQGGANADVNGKKRDTMVFLGPGPVLPGHTPRAASYHASPPSTWGKHDTSNIVLPGKNEETQQRPIVGRTRRGSKVHSGEFRQEGGILGKLGFEDNRQRSAQSRDNSWIEVTPIRDMVTRDSHMSANEELMASPVSADGKSPGDNDAVERKSEEMEILESVEKKQKFWKGPRLRRASKAASDFEVEEPGSPTPRKSTFSTTGGDDSIPLAARSSVDLVHPRPQQIRRPSSSLFHNPFSRTLSRTSLTQADIEVPTNTADDKSFQLKSFRHISGTSDIDGTGGLQSYLAHVPRDPVTLDKPDHGPTPDISSPVSNPPSAFSAPQTRVHPSSRPQISRPPSVAASLASMDEMASSNRISAAAFRKGIRRPSEGPGTVVLNDRLDGDDDDDEDNVPLGLIGKQRNKSTVSLPSMRDLPAKRKEDLVPATVASAPSPSIDGVGTKSRQATPSPRPSRPTSPKPNIAHAQGSKTPAFVVKSRGSAPSHSRQESHNDIQTSPTRSLTPSPSGDSPAELPVPNPRPATIALAAENFVESPSALVTDRPFSIAPPISAERTRRSGTGFEVQGHQAETGQAAPDGVFPRHLPAVEPVRLPVRGATSLPFRDLPSPPDQMPDTPPRSYTPAANAKPEPTSPRTRKISLLEEPLRVISGLWAGSPADDGKQGKRASDAFDPDLVVSSMAVFGEEPKKQEATRVLPSPPSKPDLFNAGSSSQPGSSPRSPIEQRLANAAASPRPVLSSLPSNTNIRQATASWMPTDISLSSLSKLIDEEKAKDEKSIDPAAVSSHSQLTAKAGTGHQSDNGEIKSSFARAPRPIQQRASTSHLRGRAAWSSSESEDESESSPRVNGKGKNRGKNAMSTRRQHPAGPRGKPRAMSTTIQKASSSSSSSSEDESLSVLRAKASRSSLANNRTPPTVSAAPTGSKVMVPPISLAPPLPMHSPVRSPAKSVKSNLSQSYVAPSSPSPQKDALVLEADRGQKAVQYGGREVKTPSRPTITVQKSKTGTSPAEEQGSSSAVQSNVVTSKKGKSPGKTSVSLPSFDQGHSGSPESSSQSATSESLTQHPVTPKDGNSGLRRGSVPDAIQHIQPDEREQLHPQLSLQATVTGSEAGMIPNGMDPAAMHNMMKQAWQAQFMAAAYRASEDEWERASMISGQNASSPPSSSAGLPPFASRMPSMGYGYPGMPMQMPAWPGMPGIPGMPGMPNMGMQMPQMGGVPWYPPYAASTSGQSVVNQPTGGGMYSYGSGAQSVFGGEFGPPRNTHYSAHPQQNSYQPSHHPQQVQSHYAQSSYAQPAYGYELQQGGGSEYGMSPPRPGYLRGHGRTASSGIQAGGGGGRQSSYSSYGGGGREVGREEGARAGEGGRAEGQWDDVPTPRKRRQSSFGPGHLVN